MGLGVQVVAFEVVRAWKLFGVQGLRVLRSGGSWVQRFPEIRVSF